MESYEDNLVTSESDPERFAGLYSLAKERFQKGGFVIKFCNTICNTLIDRMKKSSVR